MLQSGNCRLQPNSESRNQSETVIFHQPDFRFGGSLWTFYKCLEEQLTQWWLLPIQWPERWSCRPFFSGRRSTPVFSGELLNRHGRRLHAFGPVCCLRLSSSELWSWSSPFTLKFLLGHSLLSCCLLFFFSLFRISVEVEIQHDLPWVLSGDGATHAQNFPGVHPHQTR